MEAQNLNVYSDHEAFVGLLESFGVVQKGHFEYKGKAEDGTRKHGDYYINYRLLKTDQELALRPHYVKAINEWWGDVDNLIIVGVAMASLSLPKVIQLQLFEEKGIEYAYTEKREGVLGIYGEQAAKIKGKHLLFIEDICNNGTSTKELLQKIEEQQDEWGITGFNFLYGVHRGHTYFESPEGAFAAMGHFKALAYHKDECPECAKGETPLKEYKK